MANEPHHTGGLLKLLWVSIGGGALKVPTNQCQL